MCIRDRCYKKGEGVAKDEREAAKWYRLAAEQGYADAQTNSVSYTHLRAHETVLDLVCRLLLEKKNITYTHILHNIIHIHHKPTLKPIHHSHPSTHTIPTS